MEVRGQILTEATRLFAAHGFDGTSLKDIADAVGIRKPSLLYHFPSKEALHAQVLEQVLAHWNDVLPRLLLAAARDTRFEGVMEELVSFFLHDPDRARLLVREVMDRPEEMRARLATYVSPWIGVVAEQIDNGRDQGLYHPDCDAESYAVHVINLVVGSVACLASLGVLVPGKDDQERQKRLVRELMRIARASLFLPRPAAR
jgi:AcrR family transcriptional regulator